MCGQRITGPFLTRKEREREEEGKEGRFYGAKMGGESLWECGR